MVGGLVIITYSLGDLRQGTVSISSSVTRRKATPLSEECYELHEMTEPIVKAHQQLP